MQFSKNKTLVLLILFYATFPLLSMNPLRISQKEKRIAQIESRKKQLQTRKTFQYPESMYNVDAPRLQPTPEIIKSTFFSKLSDWWYGTSKYIPIGATEPKAPKTITITSKQLDGDSKK